jgi:integrase
VNGLQLNVKPSGARSWILRVVVGKRRREYGLGGYPTVTLKEAREKARTARALIEGGTDPSAAKRAARAELIAADAKRITFTACAEQYLRSKAAPEFRNSKHSKQWRTTLETYAEPSIGRLPVADIEPAHVLNILQPIWTTKHETARRLRARIEAVLGYALASGYMRGENAARLKNNLDKLLPNLSRRRTVKHHTALPWQDVGAFMAALRKREGFAARALEFAVLTAARSGEVRGATWSEIDLKHRVWRVPGERMKANREHVVPLSGAAVTLLEELPSVEGTELLFPSARGGKLSDMALLAVMQRMKVDATPHGFRSSFRDWCAENTSAPREVAEKCLAHKIENEVEAAYQRGAMLTKRAKLMAQWATYCGRIRKPATVTDINKPARSRARA